MRQIKFRTWNGEEMFSHDQMVKDRFTLTDLNRENVMQFTGIHDKNGKEIYEGDILKDSRGQNWVVSWNNNHACFMVAASDNSSVVAEVIDNENMEVIGNIFEPINH